jgi:propionyl-CoA carboxylase alpha chain
MAPDRFRDGRLTTGYIAEEFPEGFAGVTLDDDALDRLAALACCSAYALDTRTHLGSETCRAVVIGERRWDFAVAADGIEYWLTDRAGRKTLVETGWRPGMSLAIARIDGDLPRVADLLPLMPVKLPPDLSRFLLCPMPGQVVRLDVAEGDIVEAGQPLAIVEAMKMENVLKAERRARVGRLRVAAGAVLAVDEVILEFEAV